MDIYLELKDFLRALKKFRWLVPALFAAGVILAFLNHTLQLEGSTASTSFIVGADISSSETAEYNDYTYTHSLVNTCASLLKSNSVLNEAIKKCGLNMRPSDLLNMIDITTSSENDMIVLEVTASKKTDAVNLANALVEAAKSNISLLNGTIPIKLTVVDKAAVDLSENETSSLLRSLALGGFAGLFISLAIIVIITAFGTKIKKEEVAQRATGFISLGILPEITEGSGSMYSNGILCEALRAVKANIRAIKSSGKCIAVTSAEPMEGRSSVSANLSSCFAEAGFRTLLLKTDLRRPNYGSLSSDGAKAGISDYLELNAGIDEIINPLGNNLDVITAGKDPARHINLLDSSRMENLLGTLRTRYDYIIADTPAINLAAEAAVLSRFADSAVLLIRYDYTSQKAASTAAEKLRRSGANVDGFVLSGIPEDAFQEYMDAKLNYYR